jgi:hypothetical protein
MMGKPIPPPAPPRPPGRPRRAPPRAGATLLEMILYLALAGGLVTGGLVLYRQVSLAHLGAESTLLAVALSAETEALLRRAPPELAEGAAAELTRVLATSGAVPAGRAESPCRIAAPWGGCVEVWVYHRPGMVPPRGYWLTLRSLPVALCSRLAVADGRGSGPLGHNIAALATWPGPGTGPAAAADAPGLHLVHGAQEFDGAGVFCRIRAGADGRTNLGLAFARR